MADETEAKPVGSDAQTLAAILLRVNQIYALVQGGNNMATIIQVLGQIKTDFDAKIAALKADFDAGLEALEEKCDKILKQVDDPITSIDAEPGTPTQRNSAKKSEGKNMAGAMKAFVVNKASRKMKALPPGQKAGAPVVLQLIQDNQDNTVTVEGQDAAGFDSPLDGIAQLLPAPTTDDATVLSADPPAATAVVFTIHGLKPGSTTLHIGATWNDNSVGPFTIDVPVTVNPGPATGLDVQFGTPTVRP